MKKNEIVITEEERQVALNELSQIINIWANSETEEQVEETEEQVEETLEQVEGTPFDRIMNMKSSIHSMFGMLEAVNASYKKADMLAVIKSIVTELKKIYEM